MAQLTRLKLIRQRKALTQQQLADKAKVNRVTVARLEGGHDEPFPTTVRKLADALDVQPEELMAESWSRPSNALPLGLLADHGPLAGRLAPIDQPGVSRLFAEKPELASIVQDAANQLARLMPDARLKLELMADPDYGEGEQLFLGVSTSLSEEEALEALRRFDQDWWVHHVRRAHGLLCIDLNDE